MAEHLSSVHKALADPSHQRIREGREERGEENGRRRERQRKTETHRERGRDREGKERESNE